MIEGMNSTKIRIGSFVFKKNEGVCIEKASAGSAKATFFLRAGQQEEMDMIGHKGKEQE
jgi:hypothetical protein